MSNAPGKPSSGRSRGPLGLKLEEAAEGIIRVINAVMAKAIRRLSVEKGYDPREFTLVSFGGAGPLHATMLAAELQIPRVLVPLAPGVSSSLGLLTADFRHDFVRTVLWKMPQIRVGQLGELCAQLEAQALERMTREHVDARDVIVTPSADLRYQGQGFSLETRFTLEELKAGVTWKPWRPDSTSCTKPPMATVTSARPSRSSMSG